MKQKITKDMVRFVLQEFPESRNDDLFLGNKICEIYSVYILGTNRIKEANTITRLRRKFQQEGEYMPTEYIGNRRKKLAESYRSAYVSGKKEIQEQVLKHLIYRQQSISLH